MPSWRGLPPAAPGSGSTRRSPPSICARMSRPAAARSVPLADPARLPRATKNQTEIAGTRAAHRRDGAAVPRCWPGSTARRPATLDEITAVTQLEEFRRHDRRRNADAAARRSPSTPSPAPGRTARSCTTASRTPATAASQASELFLHRFRRAIPGRHHRHHPHRRRRHADRRDAPALYDRAQGHGRHLDAALSRGNARHGHRRRRPASPTGRPASTMRTAPGTASAHICRCMKGRSASPRPAAKNCWPA